MSHFELNKKYIRSIMENSNLSDEEKDNELCNALHSKKIKGGEGMIKKTKIWIESEYPNTLNEFKLLVELKFGCNVDD